MPGTQLSILDGGLNSRRVPKAKRTLVLGTAGKGPAGIGYQVTQRSGAAVDFGLEGSLIHTVEEVATYCDNIVAYRVGTKPAILSGIGES